MKISKSILLLGMGCFSLFSGCQAQTESSSIKNSGNTIKQGGIVGGGCDGCELMFVGMPSQISAVDTSAGWYEKGQKLMITGTVFQLDGKNPAPDVIIYYWQTDNEGNYSPEKEMPQAARRHGHIRGWIKTDKDGKYTLNTIRPANYPNEDTPSHIHLSIKEPDVVDEYYVDEINFDDDKLLIPHFKKYPPENRGGSGVLRVLLKGELQIAEHDIILGLNIPNYPKKLTEEKVSGLPIGYDQPSFIPYHAFGPDKGTQTCPVCKYGRYHGIIYFVGNEPDWEDIRNWLQFLELESIQRQQYLKAYFVYGNEEGYIKSKRQVELEKIGKELRLKQVALTFVPSFADQATETNLNQINPEVQNTFVIYKHRSIIDKFIDLEPTPENFRMLSQTLDKTKGEFFGLREPHDVIH